MRGEDGVRVLGNHRVLLLVLVLAASTWTVTGSSAPTPGLAVETRSVGLTNPLALQPHDPIHITGNEGFNASNGVQSGSGTVADPYIISNWLFDAAFYPNSNEMIWIENTDRHVVVQNCQVIHFDMIGEHYQAFYVGKYPSEIKTPTIAPPTIDLTSNVTFLNNDIDSRYGYGIQIAEGSSNVLVKGNRITIHPDNVSGRDWIYGINAARNTHAISIEDNLVNAASRQYITIGIHLSDYYVSEQRRASQLVARNNTVIDASGGIHVESSRFTLVRDNIVYQTDRNSLLYGWPRAITVRESALNASLIHNTIRVEVTGIVIGAAVDPWDAFGPITGASNTTIRDNIISNVDTGVSIGNVSGTHVVHTTFSSVALQELNLNGERGPPRDLRLTDLSLPLRIRAPSGAVPISWSWADLAQNADYHLVGRGEPTDVDAPFTTNAAGVGSVDIMQPLTSLTAVTTYSVIGPIPPSGGIGGPSGREIPYLLIIAVCASISIVIVIESLFEAVERLRRGTGRRD